MSKQGVLAYLEKNNLISKVIAFFMGLSLLSSCKASSLVDKQKLLNHLKNKYNVEFKVLDVEYIVGIDTYRIRVAPINNPSIEVTVDYRQDFPYSDNYLVCKFHQEATDYLKNEMESLNLSFPFSCMAMPSTALDNLNLKDLPSWETIFFANTKNNGFHCRINFFSKPNDEALSALIKLDKKFRKMKLERVSFFVNFIDEASLDGKSVDSYNFGYNQTSDKYFERQHQDYFIGKIYYYINPKKEYPPTQKEILEALNRKFLSGKAKIL